ARRLDAMLFHLNIVESSSWTRRTPSVRSLDRSGSLTDTVLVLASATSDAQAQSADQRYRALLAVSEAIASHRDLSALFHELAGQLRRVVLFDYLALSQHEATSNTMRMHVLEGAEPTPLPSVAVLPLEEDPAGWVWQTQQARIFSNVPEEKRWP